MRAVEIFERASTARSQHPSSMSKSSRDSNSSHGCDGSDSPSDKALWLLSFRITRGWFVFLGGDLY